MIFILLGHGFEEIEAICPYDILKRGGADVKLVGVGAIQIRGGQGLTVTADMEIGELTCGRGDMIVIPGGLGGVASIEASEKALALIRAAHSAGAEIAAICAAPGILARLGLIDGKNITCYPGMDTKMAGACVDTQNSVVTDTWLTTARAAGSSLDFGLKLLERVTDEKTAQKVKSSIYYDGI